MKSLRRISGPSIFVLGVPILMAAQLSLHPLLVHLPAAVVSVLAQPLYAVLKIVPGLLLGLVAARNPVAWAALAAVLGSVLCNFIAASSYEPFSLAGASISAGMYVALASAASWVWRERRSLTGHSSGPPTASAEFRR